MVYEKEVTYSLSSSRMIALITLSFLGTSLNTTLNVGIWLGLDAYAGDDISTLILSNTRATSCRNSSWRSGWLDIGIGICIIASKTTRCLTGSLRASQCLPREFSLKTCSRSPESLLNHGYTFCSAPMLFGMQKTYTNLLCAIRSLTTIGHTLSMNVSQSKIQRLYWDGVGG